MELTADYSYIANDPQGPHYGANRRTKARIKRRKGQSAKGDSKARQQLADGIAGGKSRRTMFRAPSGNWRASHRRLAEARASVSGHGPESVERVHVSGIGPKEGGVLLTIDPRITNVPVECAGCLTWNAIPC